jgi:hypothetical protein
METIDRYLESYFVKKFFNRMRNRLNKDQMSIDEAMDVLNRHLSY